MKELTESGSHVLRKETQAYSALFFYSILGSQFLTTATFFSDVYHIIYVSFYSRWRLGVVVARWS